MDVEEQLKISMYFAIHADESTDVSNCAIFLCFVLYMGKEDLKDHCVREQVWSKTAPSMT